MKRIDLVYKKLLELDRGEGVTASEIAHSLGLSRANVSNDLNKLCREGKVEKKGTKPVFFKPLQKDVQHSNDEKKQFLKYGMTSLDRFADENPSMYSAVELAKAAVLYPPNGMHMLILGETGVGKSMFANLIHEYAIEMGRMEKNSPFVVFNCAEYANNPQLLISQIFGTKKGAYTGADCDKVGLIEKADGGILFLDEIHRLGPEGQEMFFTFLDRGVFRRLGETEERKVRVLIISATTENPESVFLKTFKRRIPVVIHLPSLKERSIEERFGLICRFLREESKKLSRPIKLSVNSMRALLSYSCPNNVGQLKTDIQLACAKAYADFVSNKKEDIRINVIDLPPHVREGLYMETEHREVWNSLLGINKRYFTFDQSEKNIPFSYDSEKNIYEMIDARMHELKNKGISGNELDKELDKEIKSYFRKYLCNINKADHISDIENVMGTEIVRVVKEIIKFSQKKLNKVLSREVYYAMAIHIYNAIERIRRNKKIVNPQLNKIRTEYKQEFDLALDCLKIIERILDISMPIDEAGFLAMFFAYDTKRIKEQKREVKIIVIAHGESTATSMADAANNLLGTSYAIGINAPLDEKPQHVLSRLKTYLKENGIKSDILLLVDMGSLTTFGEEIERELGVKIKTIPLVSTLHVIEATRKAMLGYTLEEVYEETLNVNTLLDEVIENHKDTGEIKGRLAIVAICTTGEGSAVAVKNILAQNLKFDSNILEILPINLVGPENIYARLKNIEKEYRIVCIVSPFRIDTGVPQYSLHEVLSLEAIKSIQKLIDIESTYIKMGDTMENHLKNINSKKALQDIKEFINTIQNDLNIKVNTNSLIGIALHVACMLDRLKGGGSVEAYVNKESYILENRELYDVVKRACEILNKKYDINISDDEICYIMTFFNYKTMLM